MGRGVAYVTSVHEYQMEGEEGGGGQELDRNIRQVPVSLQTLISYHTFQALPWDITGHSF